MVRHKLTIIRYNERKFMPNLKAKEYRQFEEIKCIRKDGSEYWSARELAAVLDYSQWRNFQKVIDRAIVVDLVN